jgi:F0F1-type ATP synthase assembly protein I
MVECFGEGRRLSPQTSPRPGPQRSGLALAGTIGGYAALCLLVGLGVGYEIDRVTHTAPLFLISGVVLGFVVSFVLIYRLAMRELGD